MRKVTDLSNLQASLKRVKSNGGSSGVDGMEVKDLPKWLNRYLFIFSLKKNKLL